MKKAIVILSIVILVIAALIIFGRKHISTGIVIHAPAETVWGILTDTDSYPEWNPFIRKVSGEIKEGRTIEVTFHTAGSDPMVFTPKIINYRKNRFLQWEGMLVMPGIFTGRHTFRIEPTDENTTQLLHEEIFTGILAPFLNYESTIEGFTSMNNALKKRAEKN